MSGNLGANLINQLQNTPMASPDYWGKQMSNMNALQEYNAKQAWGQALQQATDPTTGTVDYGKAQALAAGNPMARAGMAANLRDTSALTTEQQTQASTHFGQIAALTPAIIQNPSDANVNMAFDNYAASSHLPRAQIEAERQRWLAMSQGDRQQAAKQYNMTAMDALQRLHMATGGTPTNLDTGATVSFGKTDPITGAFTPAGAPVTKTLTPESATDLMDVRYPDNTIHQVMRQDLPAELRKGATVIGPSGGGVSNNEAPVNAAGDSATRKASEGGPPAPGTPAAAVAQRTHDFWISQGYNEAQVAGILAGGPGSESDFNASVSGDKGTSYGLYQHHAERLAAMQKYFGLSGNQMPNEQQQNQYAAYEISPQGPLAAVGAQLKQATTPAQASAIWTRSFGVPGDKTEIGRRANGAQRYAGIYAQPGATTPPAATMPAQTTPPPPVTTPAAPASPFGQSAFAQPSTALPAPASQATAPNTTAAVPAVPTPQKAAAMAIAQRTGRPAPIAGTDGLFVDKNGNVGSGPNAGGLGRRADIPNALLTGVQTAQTTMPPANVLTAGPGAPTSGLPSGAAPTVPPPTAFGSAAFGGAPAAPPAPVVTAQPPAQAVPPQAGRGAGWSAPVGYTEKVKADVGGYVADQAAYPAVMTRAQNMAHAYEALQQLQSATGKGAQGINDLRSWAQTLGIAPPGAIKEQQLMEVINKYTERAMLDAAGGSGTDLARQMQSQANPNTGLSTPANLELLRNDMGKSLQTMAAYRDQKDKTGTGYLGNRADVAEATDPRGFVWNLYSPTEQASINTEVARDKTGTAANKLHKAIGMSQRLNLQIPGLTAQ